MKILTAHLLLSIFSTSAFAAVNISPQIEHMIFPSGLLILDDGITDVCAPRVGNLAIQIEGTIEQVGNDTAKYRIIAIDEVGNQIAVKSLTNSPIVVSQKGTPVPAKNFKYYLVSKELCASMGKNEVLFSELAYYMTKLKLRAAPTE